jgi:hypothetical protein
VEARGSGDLTSGGSNAAPEDGVLDSVAGVAEIWREDPGRTVKKKNAPPRSMCDMAEEEFAEYLLWLEAERIRSRAPSTTPTPRANPIALRIVPPSAEPAEA